MMIWLVAVSMLLLAGCTEVVYATLVEIQVETGILGEILPGTRHWWGGLRTTSIVENKKSSRASPISEKLSSFTGV